MRDRCLAKDVNRYYNHSKLVPSGIKDRFATDLISRIERPFKLYEVRGFTSLNGFHPIIKRFSGTRVLLLKPINFVTAQ